MKRLTIFAFVAVALLSAGFLQAEMKENKVRRLGDPRTSFYRPSLQTLDHLKTMVETKRGEMYSILQRRGWHGNMEDFVNAVMSGNVTQEKFEKGARIPFMAMRRKGNPDVIENVVWAGSKPFTAFKVEFDSQGYKHQFFVPLICGNFWYVEEKMMEPPKPSVSLQGAEVCVTQASKVQITVENPSPGTQVKVTLDGTEIASFEATSGTTEREIQAFAEPGAHVVSASMEGAEPTTATVNVKACPPVCALNVTPGPVRRSTPIVVDASGSQAHTAITGGIQSVSVEVLLEGQKVDGFDLPSPEWKREDVKLKKKGNYTIRATATDAAGQTSVNTCEANLEVTAPPLGLFVAGFAGKERMVQEGLEDDPTFFGGRCAFLVGGKFGILYEFHENAELEASGGVKINGEDSENSSVFADVALNGLFGRGFVGAGVSFWDLTEDDTRAAALLLQFGFDLDEDRKWQLVVEGRAPFDQFDDLENNYMFWGGIRYRFGR